MYISGQLLCIQKIQQFYSPGELDFVFLFYPMSAPPLQESCCIVVQSTTPAISDKINKSSGAQENLPAENYAFI